MNFLKSNAAEDKVINSLSALGAAIDNNETALGDLLQTTREDFATLIAALQEEHDNAERELLLLQTTLADMSEKP